MKGKVSAEKLLEYEELKKFFIHYTTHFLPLPIPLDHPAHPVNSLASLESAFGISRALVGLRQGVNDFLEDSADLSPTQIAVADASLSEAGAMTLTEAIRRRSKVYKNIWTRKKIRNDTEFYLVSTVLSDTALRLPETERAALNSMVSAYESGKN